MTTQTLADRLSGLIASLGLGGVVRIAEETGVPKGSVSKISAGITRAPEPETLRKLADHFRVRYEWLAIGRGPMTDGDSLAAYELVGDGSPALRKVLGLLAPSLTPDLVRDVWTKGQSLPDRSEIAWADLVVRAWVDADRPAPALPAEQPREVKIAPHAGAGKATSKRTKEALAQMESPKDAEDEAARAGEAQAAGGRLKKRLKPNA